VSQGTLRKTNDLPSERVFEVEGESRFGVQIQVLRFVQGVEVTRIIKIDRQCLDHARPSVDLGGSPSFDLVPCGGVNCPAANGVKFV